MTQSIRMKGYIALAVTAALSVAAAGQTTLPTTRLKLAPETLLTPGPAGSRGFAVDGRVYDLKTLRPMGPPLTPAVAGPGARGGGSGFPAMSEHLPAHWAPSPDGKSIAESRFGEKIVIVYSTVTGMKRLQINAPSAVSYVSFAGNDTLLIGSSVPFPAIDVWDLKTNTSLRRIQREEPNPWQVAAVSASGHYVAIDWGSDVIVYDTRTASPAAKMTRPPNEDRISMNISVLAFSDDTRELAGISDGTLLVWDYTGNIVVKEPLPSDGNGFKSLAWLPDNTGWLINGSYLYDRASHQVVMWRENAADVLFGAVLSHEACVGTSRTEAGPELRAFAVPWEAIKKSLAAAAHSPPVPAVLARGSSVAVDVKVDALGGEGNPQQQLMLAAKEYFKDRDVTLQPNAPLTLQIVYSEAPGKSTGKDDWAELSVNRHRTGGDTVTVGTLKLTLVDGGGKVLWTLPASVEGFRYVMAPTKMDWGHRTELREFVERVRKLPLPLFIGADNSGALPVVIKD